MCKTNWRKTLSWEEFRAEATTLKELANLLRPGQVWQTEELEHSPYLICGPDMRVTWAGGRRKRLLLTNCAWGKAQRDFDSWPYRDAVVLEDSLPMRLITFPAWDPLPESFKVGDAVEIIAPPGSRFGEWCGMKARIVEVGTLPDHDFREGMIVNLLGGKLHLIFPLSDAEGIVRKIDNGLAWEFLKPDKSSPPEAFPGWLVEAKSKTSSFHLWGVIVRVDGYALWACWEGTKANAIKALDSLDCRRGSEGGDLSWISLGYRDNIITVHEYMGVPAGGSALAWETIKRPLKAGELKDGDLVRVIADRELLKTWFIPDYIEGKVGELTFPPGAGATCVYFRIPDEGGRVGWNFPLKGLEKYLERFDGGLTWETIGDFRREFE